MKPNFCKKCNNGYVKNSGELCPECLEVEKCGGDLYSGEALRQDPQVKKLLTKARIELENGNLLQAKYYGRQAESLQPCCTSVLSFMGELYKASGEESLSADYHARVMQLPKINNLNNNQLTADFPRHIWLAILLLMFVFASAIAMMIAVKNKENRKPFYEKVMKTSAVISEPVWTWQEATLYNVEKDKTVIPNNELTMKSASDAYNSGNYQRAVVIYTRLSKSKNVDPYIYQYLAYSYQRLGDSQHAVHMLKACINKCNMNKDKNMQTIESNMSAIKMLTDTRK